MKRVLFRAGVGGGRFNTIEPPCPYDPRRHSGHFREWVQDMVRHGGPEGQYLIITEEPECRTTRAYLYDATVLAPMPPVEVMPI